MWSSLETIGTIGHTTKAFAEALFEHEAMGAGQVYLASATAPEDTATAIRETTARLLYSLLEKHYLSANDIICAYFISDLTAEYPARAARELLGWQTIPLLCARETDAPAHEQGIITSILLVKNQRRPADAEREPVQGLRGATILAESSEAQLKRELGWLFGETLARNRLRPEAILRAIVTVSPDLSSDAARAAARDALGPAIPLLVAQEIDVPGAPSRCLRTLLLVQASGHPQPVYSEQARRLLRPDLPKQPPHTARIFPSGPLHGALALPASKYQTLRAILAALLANGISTIENPAQSDDTDVLLRACEQLGARIESSVYDGHRALRIWGVGGRIMPASPLRLDMGNAGAVLRLLLGICAASPAEITFTTSYPDSLGRRPNADLLQALAQLGVEIKRQGPGGTLPITLQGGKPHGGLVRLSGKKSSQFLSALLYLAPLLEEDLEIEITDTLTSASFVDLTIRMLRQAGITIFTEELHRRYRVPGGQRYRSQTSQIPGDYPSAAALLAAVAVAKGEITLHPLPPDEAAGAALLEAFAALGLEISRDDTRITARSLRPLRGIRFDGNTAIDSVPCLAAAACFASSPSLIYNIANLRLKESDRIYDLAAGLNALGCRVIPSADALEIHPVTELADRVEVDALADHRLAQALTVAALGSQQPVMMYNAQQVTKSYPQFFDDLVSLGARIEIN